MQQARLLERGRGLAPAAHPIVREPADLVPGGEPSGAHARQARPSAWRRRTARGRAPRPQRSGVPQGDRRGADRRPTTWSSASTSGSTVASRRGRALDARAVAACASARIDPSSTHCSVWRCSIFWRSMLGSTGLRGARRARTSAARRSASVRGSGRRRRDAAPHPVPEPDGRPVEGPLAAPGAARPTFSALPARRSPLARAPDGLRPSARPGPDRRASTLHRPGRQRFGPPGLRPAFGPPGLGRERACGRRCSRPGLPLERCAGTLVGAPAAGRGRRERSSGMTDDPTSRSEAIRRRR